MAIKFVPLAEAAYARNASDIHLVQDNPIHLRIDGVMRPVKDSNPSREELEAFLAEIGTPQVEEDMRTKRGTDFSWQPDEKMRFRVAAYYERDCLRLVLRLIKSEISTIDDLELPDIVKTIAGWKRGLVLVTGATGSGKSTTLAAIINQINETERRCIITIEDPIETIHPNKSSVISQREVGRDVQSFGEGLVQALRQDPDVILIGEMRDPETIITALRGAETGHYVFSTMHTTDALHTIERILSEFPETEREMLRQQLANNLRATITQRLVRRTGGKGRAAALEILIVNGIVQKLMLENKIAEIGTVMRGRRDGMILFDQHLADLVREKKIDFDEALNHVEDEFSFKRYVEGRLTSMDSGGIIG